MYLLKRIGAMVPLLLGLSFLCFVLVRIAPGGPFDKDRAPASPEVERSLKAKYHLDEPLPKQYLRYLGGLLKGDFGPSLKYRNHTVADIISQGLPVSLAIGATSFLFAVFVGVPLGFLIALTRGGKRLLAESFTLLLVCVPPFVVGPILVLLFAIKFPIFPVALLESPLHFVLPTVTLGIYFAGRIANLTKAGVEEVLRSPFIIAARAKGLSETALLLKHVLRLGIMPVVTYSGPLLADLLTGSFVVENLFQLPGIGVFMVNSSLSRDYPMVLGLVLLYAMILLVLNLLVDLGYLLLDPRIRYE